MASYLSDDNDNLIGYRGAATDISLNKLQAISLEQAYLEAEKAAAARSNFLAMMSHEIRTPLNAIIGLSGVLRSDTLQPEQYDYATRIERSGQHLLQLLNDILDYSKLDAGEFDLENSIFKLDEQINISIDIASTYLEKKPVLIETNIQKAVPKYLKGDTARLRQILVNLIGNAAKFTEKGKITISVSYIKEKEDQISLNFDITDTGIGIPKDGLETLFEKFTQISSPDRERQGGTGLGLAICKEIISIMNGEMGVKSTLGQGSTFWFNIPFSKPSVEEIDKEYNREHISICDNSDLVPMRILVAEDSINNQLLIQKILEKRGHIVNIVANGKEAVKAIESVPYDLIFMDIQMPEMDGIEATQKIRSLNKSGQSIIPIIALTADAISGAREKYLKAGMNDYIKKPIDIKKLDQTLDRWGIKKGDTIAYNNNIPTVDGSFSEQPDLLNEDQFKQLINELGKEDLLNAYNVLWDSIQDDLKTLSYFIKSNSTNEVRAYAHKIKGTAGSFAANAVSDCAYQIESNATDKRIIEDKAIELTNILFQTKETVTQRLLEL